ncbi:hypothetical protein C8R45DRAFT_1133783 [Mycena sanguinolenta]|nr:hypothetical protein C8R45DRAFT_1133783 [Mycena sanguinolenta]
MHVRDAESQESGEFETAFLLQCDEKVSEDLNFGNFLNWPAGRALCGRVISSIGWRKCPIFCGADEKSKDTNPYYRRYKPFKGHFAHVVHRAFPPRTPTGLQRLLVLPHAHTATDTANRQADHPTTRADLSFSEFCKHSVRYAHPVGCDALTESIVAGPGAMGDTVSDPQTIEPRVHMLTSSVRLSACLCRWMWDLGNLPLHSAEYPTSESELRKRRKTLGRKTGQDGDGGREGTGTGARWNFPGIAGVIPSCEKSTKDTCDLEAVTYLCGNMQGTCRDRYLFRPPVENPKVIPELETSSLHPPVFSDGVPKCVVDDGGLRIGDAIVDRRTVGPGEVVDATSASGWRRRVESIESEIRACLGFAAVARKTQICAVTDDMDDGVNELTVGVVAKVECPSLFIESRCDCWKRVGIRRSLIGSGFRVRANWGNPERIECIGVRLGKWRSDIVNRSAGLIAGAARTR